MKLKDKDIESLVEKFYEGKTNEQEELLLKANAHQNEDFNHKSLKMQFETMKVMKNERPLGKSFDEMIMKEIEGDSSKRLWFSKSNLGIIGVITSIAALLIMWFGINIFQNSYNNNINDPIVAFQETRWALDEVSTRLNQGLNPAKKTINSIDNNINKSKEVKKMSNALKKVKTMQKIEKASYFLQSISKVYVNHGNS